MISLSAPMGHRVVVENRNRSKVVDVMESVVQVNLEKGVVDIA